MFSCFMKKATNKAFNEMSKKEITFEVRDALDTNNLKKFKQILQAGWDLDNLPYRRYCRENYYGGRHRFVLNYINFYPTIYSELLNYMLLYSNQKFSTHADYHALVQDSLFHRAFLDNDHTELKSNIYITADTLKEFLQDYQLTSQQIDQASAATDYLQRKNNITPQIAEGIRQLIDTYKVNVTLRP